MASAQWVAYEEDRVFEFLPDILHDIHRADRKAVVIIEADSDPLLRQAYPYDHRVFVIPSPTRRTDVFRTGVEAAEAFRNAMEDTAVFVGEIYGLVEDGDEFDIGVHESRPALTASQLRGLMSSPLGDELATRILLQPSHHGLLESDVLVVNTGIGGVTEVLDEAVTRLEKVLRHVHCVDGRRQVLYACDPCDPRDPLREQLVRRMCSMLTGCDGKNAGDE